MNGVTRDMLVRCLQSAGVTAGHPSRFSDLRVALRVIPIAPQVESFGVVVTRDEAGNVFSSDTSDYSSEKGAWLARRAGRSHASPAGQRAGAVLLMDEVLRSEIRADRIKVTTDGR